MVCFLQRVFQPYIYDISIPKPSRQLIKVVGFPDGTSNNLSGVLTQLRNLFKDAFQFMDRIIFVPDCSIGILKLL